jgi:hypothetical protein
MSPLPKELEESKLFQLVTDQQMIASYIHAKLEILQYWKHGYDTNVPVLMNDRFLIFNAHIYYRSLIIDFCALFGSNRKTDRRSFFLLRQFYPDLTVKVQEAVEQILIYYTGEDSPFEEMRLMRNRQIAHYDIEEVKTLTFNFDHLDLFAKMYEDAIGLIKLMGRTFTPSVGFDFKTLSKLNHFTRLIDDAARGQLR